MNRTYFSILILLLTFNGMCLAASPYKLNTKNELIYLGAGGLMALGGFINEQDRSAPTLSELDSLDKNNIPSFDRQFAGKWNKTAHHWSDALLLAGTLSPLPLFYQQQSDLLTLSVLYLETYALTAGGMALAKGSITRFRPLAYDSDAPMSEKLKHDTKRSFFSGHTALATSGFIFSATVFSDYYPDSKYKNAVWATAIGGSIATAWLRVEAGKHFPSDVIVGLLWGSAIGYGIPTLHKKENAFSLLPFANDDQQGLTIYHLF